MSKPKQTSNVLEVCFDLLIIIYSFLYSFTHKIIYYIVYRCSQCASSAVPELMGGLGRGPLLRGCGLSH